MMNRAPFRSYQSMNVVHRTREGNELWLGDYYAASDLALLRQKGIRSVLTSAAMLGIAYPAEHAINHKTISALDIPSYRMTPHFEEAYRFIAEALAHGPVLVHCAAGISRSTTFVLVYLMRAEGMSFKQAMDYVRAKRSIICPNYGFQNELKRYELTLKGTKTKQKEEPLHNYSGFSERKIVFDFANDEKRTPQRGEKLSSTVGGTKNKSSYMERGAREREASGKSSYMGSLGGNFNDPSGFLRGRSVNYSSTRRTDFAPEFKASQKYTRQYLGRVEAPRIVTIKR